MFVDDEPSLVEQAKVFLEKEDGRLKVDTAVSAEDGLELLNENVYDAVGSDYQMPGMTGLDFLRVVREEKGSDIPFIIFTGKGQEGVAMEALNMGADCYLRKEGGAETQYRALANAMVREIERREEERGFEKSEERYRRLFESAQDGMLILDADTGEIKDANPYVQNLLGYSKEELVGKKLWEIGTFKDITENKERFEKLVEEGFIRYEDLPLETKDGKEVPVEFVSNTYQMGEDKIVQSNIRDITDRKKAEKREEFLHTLLRHDVRNKIQAVWGFIELLDDFDFSEEAEKYLSFMRNSVEEGMEITEKVRLLRKAEKEEIGEVKINSAIYDAVNQFEDLAEEKGINIEAKCPEKDYKVSAGSFLNNIFSNIIENAIQHSNGSIIRIRARVGEDEVKCIIEDDGKGIPEDKKDKILTKGYTTDEDGGTGLGMFLVKTLLETYGGHMEVKDSELGGARFDLYLRKA